MKKKGLLLGLVFCLVLGFPLVGFGASITLDWDDNTEPDLTGYNVYRSVYTSAVPATGQPVIVNWTAWELIATEVQESTFTDATAPDGVSLSYQVTATDQAGNESGVSNLTQSLIAQDKTPPQNPSGLTQ